MVNLSLPILKNSFQQFEYLIVTFSLPPLTNCLFTVATNLVAILRRAELAGLLAIQFVKVPLALITAANHRDLLSRLQMMKSLDMKVDPMMSWHDSAMPF